MFATIVAVVGTLAGAITAGLIQARIASTARNAAQVEEHRRTGVDAVAALAVALSDHRRAMWKLGDALLAGADVDRLQELRDESHRTRSAITAPAVRVQLLVPVLDVLARPAIQATYSMRHPEDLVSLEARRLHALKTHDAFVSSASQVLAA